MPVVFVRYKPDHHGINGFLHSDQLADAIKKGARDVIEAARPLSKTLADSWRRRRGPDMIIGLYSRLTEQVYSNDPAAAAIEFGSGMGRPGQTGTRHQGGYSYPQRILARAGARVGDMGAIEELG